MPLSKESRRKMLAGVQWESDDTVSRWLEIEQWCHELRRRGKGIVAICHTVRLPENEVWLILAGRHRAVNEARIVYEARLFARRRARSAMLRHRREAAKQKAHGNAYIASVAARACPVDRAMPAP